VIRLTVVLLLAAIAASGCQYPHDPDGTLNRGGHESSGEGHDPSLSGSQ
jgi:hypothetical protein